MSKNGYNQLPEITLAEDLFKQTIERLPNGMDGFISEWGFSQFCDQIIAVLKEQGHVKTTKFRIGDRVRKIKGSRWQGRVVGTYSTELTPEGYAVESETEIGSVQIYPAHALEHVSPSISALIKEFAHNEQQQ